MSREFDVQAAIAAWEVTSGVGQKPKPFIEGARWQHSQSQSTGELTPSEAEYIAAKEAEWDDLDPKARTLIGIIRRLTGVSR